MSVLILNVPIIRFHWVDCQIRTLILQCGSSNAVHKALQKLPQDLKETYVQAIENTMQSVHAVDARHLLMWLAFAFEPLSREQVSQILNVDIEQQEIYPSDQTAFKLELIIDSNLVTVDVNNIVQLAHASVKEFLAEEQNWKHSSSLLEINELQAHATLGKVCIIYLLRSINLHPVGKDWRNTALYDYASRYWQAHTRLVQEAGCYGHANTEMGRWR